MKFSIALILFAVSSFAYADGANAEGIYSVPANVRNLRLISGEVISVTTKPVKVANGIAEPATTARIQFTLPGCVDSLGPVTVLQGPPSFGGRIRLSITAYAALNPESKTTQCIVANTATVDVLLGREVWKKELVETVFAEEFQGKSANP